MMTSKVLYITLFLLAFIIITGGMIFYNTQFENMFQFNFSPVKQTVQKKKQGDQDSLKQDIGQKLPPDSLRHDVKLTDKTQSQKPASADKNTAAVHSAPDKSSKTVKGNSQKEPAKSGFGSNLKAKEKAVLNSQNAPPPNDSSYIKWKKNTSKMFEAMDPKKAAKIILKYSDNTARDILYSMKKKKAAEIISELTPAYAAKLMRVK
jgi:hypothetical protein